MCKSEPECPPRFNPCRGVLKRPAQRLVRVHGVHCPPVFARLGTLFAQRGLLSNLRPLGYEVAGRGSTRRTPSHCSRSGRFGRLACVTASHLFAAVSRSSVPKSVPTTANSSSRRPRATVCMSQTCRTPPSLPSRRVSLTNLFIVGTVARHVVGPASGLVDLSDPGVDLADGRIERQLDAGGM